MSAANQPKMVILAGPPGSGKSTAFPVAAFGLCGFNADDRAAQLNGGSYHSIPSAIRAQVSAELEQLVAECIGTGEGFAIETTLRTSITFDQSQAAKKAGFYREMIYICGGEFENCLMRVVARGLAGGHSAPEQRLREIYQASLRNLPRAAREMDGIRVYDNSRAGEPPYLVLEAIGGKIEFVTSPMPGWLEKALTK